MVQNLPNFASWFFFWNPQEIQRFLKLMYPKLRNSRKEWANLNDTKCYNRSPHDNYVRFFLLKANIRQTQLGASSKSKSNFFIYLLWLSIAVDSISPIDHGEYDSKNGNNCCHDKFCHVENSFSVIGLDLFLVFRHLPLESMVVDNIILFIEQLNNCEENNLPWNVQTFLVKPQLCLP